MTPIPPSPPVGRSLLQKAIDAGPNMEPWDLQLSHQRLGHAELVLPNRGWFLEISDSTIKDDEQQAQFVRDVAFIAAASPANISEILSAHEAEVGRLRKIANQLLKLCNQSGTYVGIEAPDHEAEDWFCTLNEARAALTQGETK